MSGLLRAVIRAIQIEQSNVKQYHVQVLYKKSKMDISMQQSPCSRSLIQACSCTSPGANPALLALLLVPSLTGTTGCGTTALCLFTFCGSLQRIL